MFEAILFCVLAAWAVVTAVIAITRLNPLMSALWLAASLVALAALAGVLAAPLVAAIQLLISAGAVMVLILFVVMLVDVGPEATRPRAIAVSKILGAVAAGYLAIVMILAVAVPPFVAAPASGGFYESPLTLGALLLDRYAAAFELAGVLLLAAVVAAVVIARRDPPPSAAEIEDEAEDEGFGEEIA